MEHENPEKCFLNNDDYNYISVFKSSVKPKHKTHESIFTDESVKKETSFNPFPLNKKCLSQSSNLLNIAFIEDLNENDMNDSCAKEILKNLKDVNEKTLESFLKKDFKLIIAESPISKNLINHINQLTGRNCISELFYSSSTKVLFLVFNSQLDLFSYINSKELSKDKVKYNVFLNEKIIKLTPIVNTLSCDSKDIIFTIQIDNLNLKHINFNYIKQKSFLGSNVKIPYMETFSIFKFINWILNL